LLNGSGDDDSLPINAFGGKIGLRDGSLQISGHVLIFGSIEGPAAKVLDSRIDDTVPSTGRIQSDLSAALMDGSSASSAGSSYQDSARYFVAFRL
jgi:hypothetical protein